MEDDARTIPINPPLLTAYFKKLEEVEEEERKTGMRVEITHPRASQFLIRDS